MSVAPANPTSAGTQAPKLLKSPNMKKLFYILSCITSLIVFGNCSSNEGNNDMTDNPEEVIDYTPTKEVKQLTFKDRNEYILYKDFNCKFSIQLIRNYIVLLYYENKGSYQLTNIRWPYAVGNYNYGGITWIGFTTDLEEIDETCKTAEHEWYYDKIRNLQGLTSGGSYAEVAYSNFIPNCGYLIRFGEIRYSYVRVRIIDYKQNENGGLESATIEYQLF